MTSGNATDSICPHGWQLSNGGGENTNKSWSYLFVKSYNLIDANSSNDGATSSSAIRKAPFSVVYNGWVNPDGTGSGGYGVNGGYWSSKSYNGNALQLALSSATMQTQYGLSVKTTELGLRCVKK